MEALKKVIGRPKSRLDNSVIRKIEHLEELLGNITDLPIAWKPWGPTAGIANNVIASIRNLREKFLNKELYAALNTDLLM